MSKFIDLKNKKEYVLSENIIEVDELMLPIILELLNKGYETEYSCSGHDNIYEFSILNSKLDDYEKIANNPSCAIVDVKEDYFKYGESPLANNIYISFKKEYHFDKLPDNFLYDGKSVSIPLLYYKTREDAESNNRKTSDEIEKEIIYYNDQLLLWAKSLPIINI